VFIVVAAIAAVLLCAAGYFFVEILNPSGFKRASSKPSKRFDPPISLELTGKGDTTEEKKP
jgi:hypothetical protein